MTVNIYIGETIIDLFQDENLEVNSSVADIEDITKNTTDYTKTFTVPASSSNNKLFKHYYNATIDNSFDARIKVDGRIEMDGMLFRKGKFRLSKVSVKKGAPSSYTINFWGNLLDIKEKLGKDELSDLDLTAFDHGYNSTNVLTGLVSSGFMGGLVYTLLAKKQYYYSSDVTDIFISDELVNIGYGDGSGSNGVTWNDLRPSLRLIEIIKAIEVKYSITFSREFFGRTEFNDLFLWLNNDKDEEVGGEEQLINWDGGDSTYLNHTTDKGLYPIDRNDRHWRMYCYITTLDINVSYTIKCYVDGEVIQENTYKGNNTQQATIQQNSDNTPREIYWTLTTVESFDYSARVKQQFRDDKGGIGGGLLNEYITTSSSNIIISNFITSDNIPKIKTIDFLKGLFKMFKLVVIPQVDGTIYVNTLKEYYKEGGIYDVTNYIDFENYDVERGKILNEINFLFKEPQTILNKTFEENTRIAYGDQETKLTDDNGEVLDGTKLEFTLPFEQILYERLTDLNTNAQSYIQYGAIVDKTIAPVNPKPVIHYAIKQLLSGDKIGFINDSGTKEDLGTAVYLPSHTDVFENPNFSTLFDSEFSTWNGQKINNTLYKNYHEDYILSIFNIKKRSFKYTAKAFPLSILLNLELNDVLQIKGNYYRIDNFTSNLITRDVKFSLINSFDNTIGGFSASPTSFYVDEITQQVSTYVTNLGNFSYNKVDNGSGLSWVTVTSNTNNVLFTIDENPTGNTRDMYIDLIQAVTLQEIRIYINQTGIYIPSFKFNDFRNSQYIVLS